MTVNDYVDKLHFKMETLKSALTIVTPNCLFGCIDLKQAYFFQFRSLLKAKGGLFFSGMVSTLPLQSWQMVYLPRLVFIPKL